MSEQVPPSQAYPQLDPAQAAAKDTPLEETELESLQSPGLGELFEKLGISLLVSTYQAGKLIVMRNDGGLLNTHYRDAVKPMGIAVGKGQIAVGTTGEIQFYTDVPGNCRKLEPPEKHDACFVPRYGHLTGSIDIHEMAFDVDGRIWFINTRFSALCTIDGSPSFVPVWRPSFISAYEPEDRCHLNGLGMVNGRPQFVTALGESDKPRGWRERKADGGVLIDIPSGKVLCRGLSMPHSPRWYANQLWICESGKGTLSRVNPSTGEVAPFFEFPGFTRGLDFHGPFAFVGLSQIRETATFSGIPIAESAEERNCGVWIVNIMDGSLVGMLRFTAGVQEIFAVQVLPGLRYPEILAKQDPIALETFFLPPELVSQMPAEPARERVQG
jgi:uncharacterized protein (TIGR03032 family)